MMKVYLKIHCRDDIETVACCDEELLNQKFKDGNLVIEITNQFFGGNLIKMEEAVEILRQATNFNIVGKNIVTKAIDCNVLPKEGVRSINGIPMAIKMIF